MNQDLKSNSIRLVLLTSLYEEMTKLSTTVLETVGGWIDLFNDPPNEGLLKKVFKILKHTIFFSHVLSLPQGWPT